MPGNLYPFSKQWGISWNSNGKLHVLILGELRRAQREKEEYEERMKKLRELREQEEKEQLEREEVERQRKEAKVPGFLIRPTEVLHNIVYGFLLINENSRSESTSPRSSGCCTTTRRSTPSKTRVFSFHK